MATVPNLWEQYVIDALVRKGFEVYVPFKDKGVDILAIRDRERGRPVRIQVKGSRTYPNPCSPFYPESCWHRLNRDKVIRSRNEVDFFVFVWPRFVGHGRPEMQYLMVPTGELADRLSDYQQGRWDVYISAGQRNGKWRVADLRRSPGQRLSDIVRGDGTLVDQRRDYSRWLNNWDIIEAAAA